MARARFEHVTRRFDEALALDDFTLTCARG